MSHARRLAAICAVASAVVPFELPAQTAGIDPAADAALRDPIAAHSNATPAARPTVGLALSGGGARGGAHIGVLLALRDLRVPIDYIAGTSMGSVIGGFYASGIDEERLQALADEADWDDLFDDSPKRDDRTFHRKRDDALFLVKQQAGLNKGAFGLPLGLVQGQDMDLFLARVMLPVSHIERFDELPIPFRAVTVDMASGDLAILESGSLARAIRASLSVPAAVAPVEIDGRLLADGGVVQNLPVDTARGMGADVVIAVDISTPLAKRDELTSLVAITSQLVGFLTARGTAEQIAKLTEDDVLITPQVGDIRSLEFARFGETYAAGYNATMAVAEKLMPLALSPEDYAAHRAGRRNPRIETPPRIDFVRLDNDSKVADNIVEARLDSIPTGVPLDVDATEVAMAQVYGLELFEHVSYDVVEDGERTGLAVSVDERAWGPNYLQFGLESSSAGSDQTMFGVSASYLRTAMNRLGAEWRTTVELRR